MENLQERMLINLRAQMPTTLLNKFAQASRELYGQRREVTVLFLEINDFLQASKELDGEDFYLAVDEIIHLAANIIYKYEGTIDKFTGHGLMALFGIPLNHENDPERAVRAALEMQQTMHIIHNHLVSQYQHEFGIRIGINTGSVIAGSTSSQQHMEYTVIGDTVNLASHLQRAAQTGEILVSFSTYQRSRPVFDYVVMPDLQLQGDSSTLKTYQPTGVRLKPGQARGLPGLQVPMIGRIEHLEKLVESYKQVVSNNNSQIVLCSGDAGIGKTRLVAEFRKEIIPERANLYQGTCASYMRITPYRVVADVLRNILRISETDPENVQRKAVHQRLERLKLDRNDILPYLLHVLGLLHSDPVMEVRIKLLEPSMLQRQAHFALRMFLLAEARQAPIVLIFDDLHWVDQASGQFLEYFCQSLETVPLLLVLVSRDFDKHGYAHSILESARRHVHQPQEMNLTPLEESEAHLLVDQLIREDSPYASELKSSIALRSGGNPYYTEELVRTVMDHGGLVFHDGSWSVTSDAPLFIQEVPGTLQDLIQARFDHLPDHLKQILLTASTIGDSFAFSLLQAVVNEPPDSLSAKMKELEERDFLIHTEFGIEDGYIFKHPLLQEAIYNTLLKRDLKKYHLRIAQAIETGQHWLPGERNQILAYHYGQSNTPTKAVPYLLVSADKAFQHFANESVIQLYRQALSLMDGSSDVSSEQKGQALLGLAQALKFSGELEEAASILIGVIDNMPPDVDRKQSDQASFRTFIEALRELADIRAREGDSDYAVQLLRRGVDLLGESGRTENPTIWRRLVDRLSWVYFRQSKLDEAYNLADLALMGTRTWEAEDPITFASLYNTIGGIYWTRSRYPDAIESVEHSLEIFKNLHYHWGMAVALTNLGVLHFSIEKWPQAVDYLTQADSLRQEYGDDPERPINLKNLGEVLLDMGEHEDARARLTTGRDISQKLGLNIAQAYNEFGLCRLEIARNNFATARQYLHNARQLIESHEKNTDRVAQSLYLEALIEVKEKNTEKARQLAEESLLISELGGFIDNKVDIYRVLGVVCCELGQFDQSEAHLNKSVELARQHNSRFSEAKAYYEMGHMLLNKSQVDEIHPEKTLERADKYLESAIRIFEVLGAKHDLQQAKNIRALVPGSERRDVTAAGELGIDNQVRLMRTRLGLPEGEWYQATILVVLLLPKPGADEEFLFETVTFLIPPFVELIRENGGQVIRHQDGITAIFGAPTAHEDDAFRAVETVLQIVNYYNELDQQAELPLTIRIGVAMGKIVAGEIGLEKNPEFIAAGEALQIARLMAESCPSGQAWVTQSVRNATSFHFEFMPISPSQVEHLPVKTLFQLEGLREQILPVRGLIGLKTPFIGRKQELSAMHAMSQVYDKGLGGLIWIEGDAGIGKSRLMREFSEQIVSRDVTVWRGVCTARRTEFAFSLFSDLLFNAFDIQQNFFAEQIYEQIDHKLKSWSLDLIETRPFLQLLMGVPPSGVQGERISAMEPEQLRRQTFVAVHRLISVLASRQPVVLILDDLQWIDSISADLLLYLSHLVVSQRVLFVCAQRYKETSPFEQVLERTRSMHPDQFIHLRIDPLTIEECRQLLDEFLVSSELPDSVMSLIVQQSGGNPYFIEEFVRMLVEKDYLRLVRGHLVVNQNLQVDNLMIPPSLESLIRARIDSLETPVRQLLQVASVIGHRFNRELLARVSERENVELYIKLLHTRGMLNPTAEEEHWEFSHHLIELIVYNTVLRAQRRILHDRTASALEEQWQGSESDHAEELAYHLGRAEQHDKALFYLILAGERAAIRHANDAAVTFFEQASDLLSAVPEVSDEARWRIISGMGDVYQFIGNYDASLAVLQSGIDLLKSDRLSPAQKAGLYRRMGDTASKKGDQEQAIAFLNQAVAVLGEPVDHHSQVEAARIYARLGWCQFVQTDLENAREAVTKAREFATLASSITTLAMAENHLGGISYRQGDLQAAVQHTRTAMSYWQEIGYSWGVAAALSNLGILEHVSGDWQAATISVKHSLSLRQEMGDVDGVAITNHNLGLLMRDQGDILQAEMHFRDSLAVSRPFQMNWHSANSYVALAQSLLYQGKVEQSAEMLEQGLRLAQEINAPDVIVEAYCARSEIHLACGELTEAENSAASGAELAEQIGVGQLQATAWRLKTASLLRQGKISEAELSLERAQQALATSFDRLEDGRIHMQAKWIALAQGEMQQAQSHHEAAGEIFSQLGAARDMALLEAVRA